LGNFENAEAFLESAARAIPPGSEGLVLVPYWNSAMNPYWDAAASGIVVGWRGVHRREHLYRAILEGVALELRLHSEGVQSALGQPLERFVAVGGGARSPLWRQIVADVTNREVAQAEAASGGPLSEASALGAGVLAAAGAGLFPTIADAAAAMGARRASATCLPDPQRHAFYNQLYEDVYRSLYPALQPYLARLTELSGLSPR
jgi:sugar (pentulose or hexulose) kinase